MSIQEVSNTQIVKKQLPTESIKKPPLIEPDEQQQVESKETPKVAISSQDMSKLVTRVNEFVQTISTKIGFSYDILNERQVILVKDKDTGELIREIPPREMLNLVKQLERVTGIIYHNHI